MVIVKTYSYSSSGIHSAEKYVNRVTTKVKQNIKEELQRIILFFQEEAATGLGIDERSIVPFKDGRFF